MIVWVVEYLDVKETKVGVIGGNYFDLYKTYEMAEADAEVLRKQDGIENVLVYERSIWE